MKKTIFTWIVCVIGFAVRSYGEVSTFEKVYSWPKTDVARDAHPTSDGGFVIAGYTTSRGKGYSDFLVIKTDSKGDTSWTNTYGGLWADEAYSIAEIPGEGYIVTGSTQSMGAGHEDVYLIRIDNSGKLLWQKAFGGAGSEIGREVIITQDKNYVIAAHSSSTEGKYFDGYLLKVNPSGGIVWEHKIGGAAFDVVNSVKELADGSLIFGGETSSTGAGDTDFYLIKTDAAGGVIWEKTFGGPGLDECKYVQLTSDGGFILVGDTESYGEGESDIFLVKTDGAGKMLWSKTYGGDRKDVSKMVHPTKDGGYIIAGISRSFGLATPDMWVIKTNSDGVIIWDRFFGAEGHEHCYVTRPLDDGSFLVSGLSNRGTNIEEIYLAKINSEGKITGIEETAFYNAVKIYPLPARKHIILEDPSNLLKISEVLIYNLQGQLIHQQSLKYDNGNAIPLPPALNGFYVFRFQSDKGTFERKILVDDNLD